MKIILFQESENLQLQVGTLDRIMHTSGGDMRKAVTFLQSAYQLSGGEPITPLMVVEISGQVFDVIRPTYRSFLISICVSCRSRLMSCAYFGLRWKENI